MSSIRRSSRSNKGQNNKLNYEQEIENESKVKRKLNSSTKSVKKLKMIKQDIPEEDDNELEYELPKNDDEDDEELDDELPIDEDDDEEFIGSSDEINDKDDSNLEETVRCLVCGANDENYDEDTDKLGLMVECSQCKTWQHSKCLLGHTNQRKVPDDYKCNVCDPSRYPKLKLKIGVKDLQKGKDGKLDITKKLSFNKIRLSVAQTFHKLFITLIHKETPSLSDEEVDAMAQSLSIELEQLIFRNYSLTTAKTKPPGQKYSEKSRSLYSNLKDSKNVLFKQILDKKLTLNELVLMSPQELLNPDLQKFSKQIMEKLIQDSVLKPMQKPTFKKTHKGDELVEDDYNEIETSSNVGLIFNHDKKEESLESSALDELNGSSTQPTDTEELEDAFHRPSLIDLNNSPIEHDETADNDQQRDYQDVGLDDDLDNILNDKSVTPQLEYDPSVPNTDVVSTEVWQGELTFPGICNFQSLLKFVSTTNNHSGFERELLRMQTVMDNFSIKNFLEIEGRLNSKQAIEYLTKILKTRYLNVCQLNFINDEYNYQRLFQYFNSRDKVGIIGNRPNFVKDCYLLTFSKEFIKDIKGNSNQLLNTLINSFKQDIFSQDEVKDTILFIFVIKPNFEDELNNKNNFQILKKLPNDFYKLTSINQQKFMEIVQQSDKNGQKLNENDVEILVKHLLE